MTRAYLGLGSNLGDRAAALHTALDALRTTVGINALRASAFYETAPVGPIAQGDFLNAVAEIDTTLDPHALLLACQAIETAAGRERSVRWGPRTLDLDLLAHGNSVLAEPGLTLPHPEATRRAFVLVPWAELAPDFPLDGRPLRDWLAQTDSTGIRPWSG